MADVNIYIPKEFPVFKDLDEMVRCGICYEVLKTTMVTKCSHNYCSLCIRKSLTYKTQCPQCFEETFDHQLLNNRIVDQFITGLNKLSYDIKKFLDAHRNCNTLQCIEKVVPEINKITSVLQTSETGNVPDSLEHNINKNNVINSNKSIKPSTSFFKTVSRESETVVSEERSSNSSNEGTSRQQNESSPKVVRYIPSMFSPKKKTNIQPLAVKPVVLVPCPVCNVDIPDKNINIHLDACLKRAESNQESSVNKVERRKPLPKLVYPLLQDKDLKKKLKERGLSTQGDRKTLISRHQRFTLLYNSECDKIEPRTEAEIIRQIEKEDKEEKKVNNAGISNMLKIDKKSDPNEIEQAQKQYLKENKSSYDDLIKAIRENQAKIKNKGKRPMITSDDEDENNTKSEGSSLELKEREAKKKKPLKNHISDDETTDIEDGSNSYFKQTSVSTENNESDNGIEIMDETTFDMVYEVNSDEATSPVLGRITAAHSTGRDVDNTGHKAPKLTPDMFASQTSEADSNESFSLLSQATGESVNCQDSILSECEREQFTRKIDSQIVDPNFDPDSDDMLQDFEVRRRVTRSRRTPKRISKPDVSMDLSERRTLRKRQKR